MEKDKGLLVNEIALIQKERDEQLLMAENEKQEVLHMAANEKATLVDRLTKTQNDLGNANVEIDRIKRDAYSRAEQDKASTTQLQNELRNTRSKLEDLSNQSETESVDQKNQIKDLVKAKENALREIAEYKLQLKMVEESRDSVRRELIEAHRKIREGEEAREISRKENIDLKRQLKDEEREKEAVQQTANELRGKVR